MNYQKTYDIWVKTGKWNGPKVLIDSDIPKNRCQYCGGLLVNGYQPGPDPCSDPCRYNAGY